MEIDGDYIYWGEDASHPQGQAVFRIHRETMQVEQVGERGIVGMPWNFLRTEDDRLLVLEEICQ